MLGFEETFLLLNHHKGQVLDHYRAATNESYLQVHGKLTSPYLLLKLLPWMSERLWTESLSVDYLVTPAINNHIQVGYSLNEIAFLLDIGIYAAFEDWKYHGTGLRVNFRF
jgi:hypothetical protein